MKYDTNQKNGFYDDSKFNTSDRDSYDDSVVEREKGIMARHIAQLENAREAEDKDSTWVEDRGTIQELNENIRIRKANYDTYMNAMNVEKELYNRERHRTLLLGIANVAALGGCVAMWAM